MGAIATFCRVVTKAFSFSLLLCQMFTMKNSIYFWMSLGSASRLIQSPSEFAVRDENANSEFLHEFLNWSDNIQDVNKYFLDISTSDRSGQN